MDELKEKLLDLHPNEHTRLLSTVFDMVNDIEDYDRFKTEFFELVRFIAEDDTEGAHFKRIK